MGALLALAGGMRTLGLLVTLLVASPQAATDQKPVVPEGTIITSAQVTGFDIDRLSPGLREAIRNLAGTPLKQDRLDELAARLEAERPRYVAAVRAVMDAGGQARVFFVMGRRDQPDRDDNVNARYVVEHAEIIGIADDKLSQALRDDLHALVGKRLDSGEADKLEDRIERELPAYTVSRQITRGSEVGRIRLVYELKKKEPPPWLRFEPLRSNLIYHSEQGWSGYWDVNIGDRNIRFTPIVAADTTDDLVEEYTGYGLRFETRKLGTRRLGASLEWTSFDADWRHQTLDAIAATPTSPRLYGTRSTIVPLLKFAFTPQLSIAGGVSVTELEPLESLVPSPGPQMANAAVASIDYDHWFRNSSDAEHRVQASFAVRAGTRQLESDLVYQRFLGEGSYRFEFGRHHVQVSGMAGRIGGQAPMFERFTLGDSLTLRGWDKYDIAPAGGDRVAYSSVEYRYTGLALFLDAGSVWNANTEKRVRVSTGFGFHAGPAFLVVGFPVNTDNLTAVVTLGLRIPGTGIKW